MSHPLAIVPLMASVTSMLSAAWAGDHIMLSFRITPECDIFRGESEVDLGLLDRLLSLMSYYET
jgi:hypothetical protein